MAAGLARMGATGVEPFDDVAAALDDRRSSEMHGRLRFTFGDPATSTDINRSIPWARTIISASYAYLPDAGTPSGLPGTGRIARFASERHYQGLRAGLEAVAEALRTGGHQAEVVFDDNRLVDRAVAVRSGVGWWAKSTMVLDPKHGPWLLLGNIVTDVDLAPTEAMVRDCGTCSACLTACPTGALVEPGVLDARLCLAHWAQAPGDIPEPMRRLMGDRLYGCDDCLDACPPGTRLLEQATEPKGDVALAEVLTLDDATLIGRFGHLYIPRRNPDYLRRNAIVVLGNTGGVDDLALLGPYLTHVSPMLRRHAAWAIAEIGGPIADAMLAAALEAEPLAASGGDPGTASH